MKGLIWERKFKSFLLMIASCILIVLSIIMFFVFYKEKNARISCVLFFILGIFLFGIGLLLYKNIKKLERNQKNNEKN